MKKTILLFYFLGFIVITSTKAQDGIILETTSGTSSYAFDDVNVITFTNTDIILNDKGTDVSFAMNDINTITFGTVSTSVEKISGLTTRLYPNPTSGMLTLDIYNSAAKEIIVDVYSITGSQLMQVAFTSGTSVVHENIDLAHLEKGVYLISVNNGKQVINRKIIIN